MIILSQNNTDIWCKIDKNLKEILSQYSWKLNQHGYPVTWIKNRQITMSKFIMEHKNIDVPIGNVISYKNQNKLDNRFINLEIVKKNSYKKKKFSITKSQHGKYLLKIDNKYSGYFNSYQEAFEKIK